MKVESGPTGFGYVKIYKYPNSWSAEDCIGCVLTLAGRGGSEVKRSLQKNRFLLEEAILAKRRGCRKMRSRVLFKCYQCLVLGDGTQNLRHAKDQPYHRITPLALQKSLWSSMFASTDTV